MRYSKARFTYLLSLLLLCFLMTSIQAQEKSKGHYNESMFKELDTEWPTPNVYRTAAGAPGHEYYQQQADYVMDITLNDDTQQIFGEEQITYHNNSPDALEYLWVQLDQNVRAADSPSKLISNYGAPNDLSEERFARSFIQADFDGGFKIEKVSKADGSAQSYTINQTMMRINLDTPLKPGEKFVFHIKWNYNINDFQKYGGRSGYEHFEKDGNNAYVIAQFFPRMAVYSDVEGWQNMQFWGRSEFALPFGDYEVNITVPADHVLNGTGVITNMKEVLSKEQYKRYQKAQKTYDNPVFIVTKEEAEWAEKHRVKKTKTWKLKAENVRDFGFATSRKYVWDAMAVKINNKSVKAISLYPKEGMPLWDKYSTRVVAHTLKEYSKMTFDYPYHKAISVHAERQGMEYPMICWNYGRPDENGDYPESTKHGMISVITHEIGHNFFPMIVNSDERQWTWMDEGLNTFLQFVTEQNMPLSFPDEWTWEKNYPSRRGFAKDIVDYMSMDQSQLMPIMTQGDHVFKFGANAYGKPATGLAILRNTIMGPELFDYAFRTYAQRWKFKHPSPADFYRTMEDASGVDLDWFWRGWFYTTEYCDIGIKEVNAIKIVAKKDDFIFERSDDFSLTAFDYKKHKNLMDVISKLSPDLQRNIKNPRYFYEITFEKPGGLIMPILLTIDYEDGTSEELRIPYMVWRLHENSDKKYLLPFEKRVTKLTVDKNLETADIDLSNNEFSMK